MVVDLTKIPVELNLTLDTLDVVLLVTTGGVGYLARAAYNHFDTKAARSIDLQQRNLVRIIEEAQNKGARSIRVRVDSEVAVYAPAGGGITYLGEYSNAREIEITFG